MNLNNILFFLFATLILTWGCTKESLPTLTFPTSFTFNTPSLEDRSVFRIDTSHVKISGSNNKEVVWTFRRLTDTLGSYDKSNPSIADTLNYMIREEFADQMISKITLLSASQMEIEYSRLIKDTLSPQNDKLQFLNTIAIPYEQVGNILAKGMFITNDFREIYICNSFILAIKRINITDTYQEYFKYDCNGPDPVASLDRFVQDVSPVKFDTASVEYVNYIFSSYK